MNCAVYAIKNLNDMKLYVGSSGRSDVRESQHRRDLQHNRHTNPHLQHAWNRDGEYAFVFSALEVVDDPSLLREREQWWLNHLTPWGDYGYNVLKDVDRRGITLSDEMKQKISQTLKGRVKTEEEINNFIEARRGKPFPTPWMIGKHKSEETKAKISQSRAGKCVGADNNQTKLNDDAVLDIRARLSDGESGFSLAREYGVTRRAIYQIRDFITWKHIRRK